MNSLLLRLDTILFSFPSSFLHHTTEVSCIYIEVLEWSISVNHIEMRWSYEYQYWFQICSKDLDLVLLIFISFIFFIIVQLFFTYYFINYFFCISRLASRMDHCIDWVQPERPRLLPPRTLPLSLSSSLPSFLPFPLLLSIPQRHVYLSTHTHTLAIMTTILSHS